MLKVSTGVFEGPMDLLIYLIKKREVSIYDIPISEITEEFLNYINTMKELNIPVASEFMVMAATLTKIKSEMLMKPESKEDPRKGLIKAIQEYMNIKYSAEKLSKLEEVASRKFTKKIDDIIFQFQQKVKISNTVEDIKNTFSKLLERRFSKKLIVGINLTSEKFKISSKMDHIRKLLNANIKINFSKLINISTCKLEAVTYFLAALELCRLGEITIHTTGNDIILSKLFKLTFNNINTAPERVESVKIGNPAQ